MNDYVGSSNSWLGRSLTILGFLAVGTAVVLQYSRGQLALWLLASALASCVGWLLLSVFRLRGPIVSLILLAVMALGGGIAATATGVSTLVPAAIAVLWLTRDLRRPVGWGAGLGVVTMILLIAANTLVPVAPLQLLTMEAGIVVAFLAGESRRQFLLGEIRSNNLIEEQARADVLAARQQIAHDIHDVLAHSLGGLVIQLDAVDALLDSGDIEAAAAKVRDARALAAEGLGEARRAVAALSAEQEDSSVRVDGSVVAADIEALVDAHRTLGGIARFVEKGRRGEVTGPLANALRRAVQEGLTNARKHAPGKPVTVSLLWRSDGVGVEISNPVGAIEQASGGGHGLVGMRDRFSALPGGAVTSGVNAGRFVVTAQAATA
ncbi:MAG TPA: histidine kinase [Galbitalea sp.]|jgi:signal transduction histidine kinase|nr:histidine kinase [Galbitalea sp.]